MVMVIVEVCGVWKDGRDVSDRVGRCVPSSR